MNMDKALREVKSDKWGKIASLSRRSIAIIAKEKSNILKVLFCYAIKLELLMTKSKMFA
jgi:hypothetical protein